MINKYLEKRGRAPPSPIRRYRIMNLDGSNYTPKPSLQRSAAMLSKLKGKPGKMMFQASQGQEELDQAQRETVIKFFSGIQAPDGQVVLQNVMQQVKIQSVLTFGSQNPTNISKEGYRNSVP